MIHYIYILKLQLSSGFKLRAGFQCQRAFEHAGTFQVSLSFHYFLPPPLQHEEDSTNLRPKQKVRSV